MTTKPEPSLEPSSHDAGSTDSNVAEVNLTESSVPLLCGVASWPWYAKYLRDPLDFFVSARKKFGPIFALGSPMPFSKGGRKFLVVSGAEYNKIVLGKPDQFRSGGQTLRGPKGSAQRRIREGIFAMNGSRHRTHRRMMQPPLLKPAIASYGPRMLSLVDEMVGTWEVGKPIDLYREMRKLSNWAAAHLLFGSEDFAASMRLGEAIELWLQLDADVRSRFALINLPGTRYRKLLQQAEQVESLMIDAINRNRISNVQGSDLLSLLIREAAQNPDLMTEKDLVAHAVILYAASFETTANALAWTLFLIAQHPATAQALNDEISSQLGNEAPDHRSIDQLPLLDAAIHESMRLLPPVAYTFRTPAHLASIDGMSLDGKDKVVPCHYLTHREPDVFPDPNRFLPERWLESRPGHYEYVAFSAGARLCMGISFALLELKITVARVMQRFRLAVVPGSRIDGIIQLTLRPKQGIPMIVYPPDQAFSASPISGSITRMVDFHD
ncbi:MAG: cytochrome P450 [Pirellulaceae bacterium]|nr:cytochrome P450 [Pirellulaceae bacterium]